MVRASRPRTVVVTGAASGIGAATAALLRDAGQRIVGVDLAESDVVADLSTPEGRAQCVAEVEHVTGGRVDAVIAAAGTVGRGADDVSVDYFGAVATLTGLRPLLERSPAPRAVAVASFAVIEDVDDEIVAACLADDEKTARLRASELGRQEPMSIYASAKRALARWIRFHAPSPAWAGAGIALNAVAPGIVRTPMTEPMLREPTLREGLLATVPMPLGGIAEPTAVARVLAFLSDANTEAVTGQVLFVDGGGDCVRRADDIWSRIPTTADRR